MSTNKVSYSTSESKAFSFGKLDRMKGIPKTQNLYRSDKTLMSEWLKGWEFQDAFMRDDWD